MRQAWTLKFLELFLERSNAGNSGRKIKNFFLCIDLMQTNLLYNPSLSVVYLLVYHSSELYVCEANIAVRLAFSDAD